jgi:hypothetical protein
MSASYYEFLALSLVISPPFCFHNYIIYFKDCKNWTNQKRLVIRPCPNNIYVTESSLSFCIFDRPCPYSPASILFSLSASYNLIIFYELALSPVIYPIPAILFSLSASYNLIIFYQLALLLVIWPFPAILFSLSASYNLIIFYELALSLVICPFPAILFS